MRLWIFVFLSAPLSHPRKSRPSSLKRKTLYCDSKTHPSSPSVSPWFRTFSVLILHIAIFFMCAPLISDSFLRSYSSPLPNLNWNFTFCFGVVGDLKIFVTCAYSCKKEDVWGRSKSKLKQICKVKCFWIFSKISVLRHSNFNDPKNIHAYTLLGHGGNIS